MGRWFIPTAKVLKGFSAAFCIALCSLGVFCNSANAQGLPETQHEKLLKAYRLISSSRFSFSADEVDHYGEQALSEKGNSRIYGLWRVLYAYKNSQDDAHFRTWCSRIRQVARQQNDSALDMLGRFMMQAYENEVAVYKEMDEGDWKTYLEVSNPAIRNVVLLEKQRQLQYLRQWAQAIDMGEGLIIRLQTAGRPAEGLLAQAHQTLAYSMLKVGDYDSYSDQIMQVALLSDGNAFFLQKMDIVYDVAYFAADNYDLPLANELHKLYSDNVTAYNVTSLKPWSQELCAFVASQGKDYRSVVSCLQDSVAAKGKITNARDTARLRLLVMAYAKTYETEKALFYLHKLESLPESVLPHPPLRAKLANEENEIRAYVKAGQGDYGDAFTSLGTVVGDVNHDADQRRISAIQDMYKTLRKELDKKTAEAKLLNKQVELRNWLLGTAVAIVLLLIAIAAGATLWVVRMRRMQWRLKEASDHAEAANAAKSRFLAVMSHELRTPLNGVLGMAQALKRDGLTDDQRAKVDTLAESGETLLMLLNDVLDMSRIEAGKVELSPTPGSMKDMIERVFNTFAPTIGEKPVALRYDLDPTAAATMSFDMLRVYQCLSNLVSNAVKFTNEGVIRVVASAEKHLDRPVYTVRIEVRDTGIGISKASLSKLFEAYTQADASTARKYGGSGLGLSITQRLTELMGGSVSVTSEEGAGSVFVMTFEAGEVAQASDDQPEASPANDLPHGVRILLVDDHPVNRKVARLFLEPFGFDITEAVDGQEALDAGMEDYDLVLMDVNMPRLGGIDATRQFRSTEAPGKHVPIIALTADALPEQIEACLGAGMDAHVSKPIVMDTLIDTVVSLLGEHAALAAKTA